jgi:chitinase
MAPASSIASSGVTLNWTAPSVPSGCTVNGYTVYQNGAALAPTTPNTTYNVTGLSPATMYSFTVAASDSSGTSPQSSPVSVTTLTTGTPPGTYMITITGKDANGITQNGGGATVTVKVVN